MVNWKGKDTQKYTYDNRRNVYLGTRLNYPCTYPEAGVLEPVVYSITKMVDVLGKVEVFKTGILNVSCLQQNNSLLKTGS